MEEKNGFIIHGLSMESAEYHSEDKRIKLTNKLSSPLPPIILRWVNKDLLKKKAEEGGEDDQPVEVVELPIYLNQTRKNLLCAVKTPTFGLPSHVWY